MSVSIKQINDCVECVNIARDLKEWFNERGIERMILDLRDNETYGAYMGTELAGFITVKSSEHLVEVLWMAVKRRYQGKGIGSALLNFIEQLAKDRGSRLIMVKTSGDTEYEPYARTRRFYEKHGFIPVLLIDNYSDWGEPMALYVKCL
ncbi:GNAT family N-acetyltransferase [Caldivirga sp.]|uniref:GNAT family N-acetyltransferase n=1 Tax=Caldivirga sp. TaxID=2080243 RepID=UPI003D096E5A